MTQLVSISELDAARRSFTELGDAMRTLSDRNKEMFDQTISSLKEGFDDVLAGVTDKEGFKETAKLVGISQKYAEDVSSSYTDVSDKMGKSFDTLGKTVDEADENFDKLSVETTNLIQQSEKLTEGAGGKKGKEDPTAARKRGVITGLPSKFGRLIVTEINTLKSRVRGMLSSLKIPTPGNILSGLIQIMAHGYMDRDRVRAEAGEVKNILIAAYDDGVKGAVAAGTRRLSGTQEAFQQFMGINRKELQASAQALVDGGLSVAQMTEKVNLKLRHVHSNAVTVTFALDKLFEIPGGDSAKRMVGLMADYGKTSQEAQDTLVRMMMVGKQSGIGAMQFVQNVETASEQLRSFGYDIDGTINLLSYVQDRFEEVGVPKQFAGRQAALGMQQMASGITNMSDSWKILVAERLGYGRGLEGRQKMMDAFARVAEKKNTNEIIRVVQTVYDIAMEAVGGDEDRARYYMENQMKMGFEGARLIAKIGKDAKEGKMVEAAKSTKENLGLLRKSFGIEAKKQNTFERFMNTWMKGLSKVGLGLMGLTASALAMLIAYVKALPVFISNAINRDFGKNVELAERLHAFDVKGAKHTAKMSRGFDQMLKAAEGLGADVLGASLKSLRDAWTFDPTGGLMGGPEEGGGGGAGATGLSSGAGLWQPYQATVKPATLPISQMGKAGKTRTILNLSMPVKKEYRSGGGWRGGWVGGGVSLEVGGVDAKGSLTFSISGNCPRCGFVFGDERPAGDISPIEQGVFGYAFSEDDVESLARMIQTESGRPRSKEADIIGWTAINRLRAGRYGKSIHDVITGGLGYGEQGAVKEGGKKIGYRAYGTARRASPAAYAKARKLLGGQINQPKLMAGATSFYHQYEGARVAKFARDPKMKNVINQVSGNQRALLRVYSPRGVDDPHREELDQMYQQIYKNKVRGSAAKTKGVTAAVGGGSQRRQMEEIGR